MLLLEKTLEIIYWPQPILKKRNISKRVSDFTKVPYMSEKFKAIYIQWFYSEMTKQQQQQKKHNNLYHLVAEVICSSS